MTHTTYPCGGRHGRLPVADMVFDDQMGKAFCRHCGIYLAGDYTIHSPIGRARATELAARNASRTWRAQAAKRGAHSPSRRVAGRPWTHISVARDYDDFNPRRSDIRRIRITRH